MSGTYRAADDVAVVDHGGPVYLARVPHGPIHVLDATAGDVWRTATVTGDEVTLVGRLAELYEVAPAEIATDVHSLLASLLGLGLLLPPCVPR